MTKCAPTQLEGVAIAEGAAAVEGTRRQRVSLAKNSRAEVLSE